MRGDRNKAVEAAGRGGTGDRERKGERRSEEKKGGYEIIRRGGGEEEDGSSSLRVPVVAELSL